jgi:transcriptional regulator with XRE-family HTH domain
MQPPTQVRDTTLADVPVLPRLKFYRVRAGLTQRDLAAVSGVQRSTIARLEGQAPAPVPSPTTVRKLATALGITPQTLWGPAEPDA